MMQIRLTPCNVQLVKGKKKLDRTLCHCTWYPTVSGTANQQQEAMDSFGSTDYRRDAYTFLYWRCDVSESVIFCIKRAMPSLILK
jgi:hypothetical protein